MITLRKGANGASVQLLQERLAAKGFLTGPVDGDFGKQTDTAVRQFQAANNLKVDGVVGDKSWALLLSNPVAVPTSAMDDQRTWLRGQIATQAGPSGPGSSHVCSPRRIAVTRRTPRRDCRRETLPRVKSRIAGSLDGAMICAQPTRAPVARRISQPRVARSGRGAGTH